jgi:hypothetical protein
MKTIENSGAVVRDAGGCGATMQYVEIMLSATDVLELVHEMRMKGYNVEKTPLGFICHEETRHGKICVLTALRSPQVDTTSYRAKLNTAFFETGKVQSEMVH